MRVLFMYIALLTTQANPPLPPHPTSTYPNVSVAVVPADAPQFIGSLKDVSAVTDHGAMWVTFQIVLSEATISSESFSCDTNMPVRKYLPATHITLRCIYTKSGTYHPNATAIDVNGNTVHLQHQIIVVLNK